MTDQFGRKLQFHGFNLVAKCPSFSHNTTTAGSPCVPGPNVTQPSYWLSPDPANLVVDPERTFTDADASQLASLGFNIARLGIIWRALEPGKMASPHFNDPDFCTPRSLGTKPLKAAADQLDMNKVNGYLSHIDDTVNLLSAHGIYSLIDMHQDDFSEHFNNPGSATPWEGEGAPLWATCTNLTGTNVPAPEGFLSSAGWAEDNLHDPALAMAADHFWTNDVSGNLQAQYIRVWQEVARHYRDNKWIVGYDPFNEPYDQLYTVVPTAFDSRLQCFYAGSNDPNSRCNATVPASQAPGVGFIPAIVNPAVDPDHLVFYEGPVVTDYHGIETIGVGVPLNYDHLVFNFHVYPPVAAFGGGECTSAACGPNDDFAMRNALQARDATMVAPTEPGGPALFASEFGAEDYAPDLAHDGDLFDGGVLSSVPVSWAYWSAFQDHDPTGQPNERLIKSDRSLVQPKGGVLARVYSRATAGTPATQSFTVNANAFQPNTAVFNLAYAPDAAVTAPTEIVVPAIQYPAGYCVLVDGANVTSGPNAAMLTMTNNAGATRVRAQVRPASGACAAGAHAFPTASAGLPPTSRAAIDRVSPARAALALTVVLIGCILLRSKPRDGSRRRKP
jgi:endoglycosylceramidase